MRYTHDIDLDDVCRIALTRSENQIKWREKMGDFISFVIFMAILIFLVASVWKIFVKAGEPGWACLIPIYNLYIFLKIVGRPWWWILLAFIPVISLVLLITPFDLAKRFDKGIGFGLGLLLLGFIFYPILGFGDAEYTAPEI